MSKDVVESQRLEESRPFTLGFHVTANQNVTYTLTQPPILFAMPPVQFVTQEPPRTMTGGVMHSTHDSEESMIARGTRSAQMRAVSAASRQRG